MASPSSAVSAAKAGYGPNGFGFHGLLLAPVDWPLFAVDASCSASTCAHHKRNPLQKQMGMGGTTRRISRAHPGKPLISLAPVRQKIPNRPSNCASWANPHDSRTLFLPIEAVVATFGYTREPLPE